MSGPKTEAVETAGPPVDQDIYHQIELFLYREARVMSEERFREWLDNMVAKDIHYWLPVVENRFRNDPRPPPTPDDPAIYNEDYADLDQRIRRLETGMVWTEDPPNRVRHNISNIEAVQTEVDGEYRVYSNFTVYRNRRQRDEATLFGGRVDILRRHDESFQIARRKINIDQHVILDKNLYLFL